MVARPYICGLSIFSRFTCPSVCPLLHGEELQTAGYDFGEGHGALVQILGSMSDVN
jgi:hypothetical protein